MTWITDGNGRRWVETPPRKRRKPARAIRFAAIKPGDQLVLNRPSAALDRRSYPIHYLVTDTWFDPVAGQDDETAGRMVAIQRIGNDGEIAGRKFAHTVRGLASQQYRYADLDYIAMCKARLAAHTEGKVVGIGKGSVIRRRPKLPGRPL